jgi:hypothetical protein
MSPRVAVLKPVSSAISIGTGGPFGGPGDPTEGRRGTRGTRPRVVTKARLGGPDRGSSGDPTEGRYESAPGQGTLNPDRGS